MKPTPWKQRCKMQSTKNIANIFPRKRYSLCTQQQICASLAILHFHIPFYRYDIANYLCHVKNVCGIRGKWNIEGALRMLKMPAKYGHNQNKRELIPNFPLLLIKEVYKTEHKTPGEMHKILAFAAWKCKHICGAPIALVCICIFLFLRRIQNTFLLCLTRV